MCRWSCSTLFAQDWPPDALPCACTLWQPHMQPYSIKILRARCTNKSATLLRRMHFTGLAISLKDGTWPSFKHVVQAATPVPGRTDPAASGLERQQSAAPSPSTPAPAPGILHPTVMPGRCQRVLHQGTAQVSESTDRSSSARARTP